MRSPKKMDHVLLSPKVWLHDLDEDVVYSAMMANDSFTIHQVPTTNRNNNNYTIDVYIAQDVIRRS